MTFDITGCFPYSVPRPEQVKAIEFALDAFYNQGKRFVIIDAGTGIGKSGVGIAIARFMERNPIEKVTEAESVSSGAWFLTTQKILQDQYVRDFGTPNGFMETIKSATNYQCKHKNCSCAESRQLLKAEPEGTAFHRACKGPGCVYVQARQVWLDTSESVTNFPFFMTFGNYAGGVKTRKLLVVDEAHNVESELSKFIDVSVSETFAKYVLKMKMPEIRTQHQGMIWIKDTYFPKVSSHLAHVKVMMAKFKGLRDKIKQMRTLSRQLELLEGHFKKMQIFLDVYDKDNWVMNVLPASGKKGRRLEFKVIDVAPFSEDNLFRFGDRVLLMSATILNSEAFCEGLGISKDQVAVIEIPSPFPAENRPILYSPVGKMSRSEIDQTLPKMAKTIKMLLEHHKDEKGIIHTHTYRIANYLRDNIRDSRILIHDSANREHTLQQHHDSSRPTVLLSPSMTEGVDLKGDDGRFQIICKIPYPYLGDPLIKKRMNRWKWWYSLQTAKSIVQSSGRSVRSMDDHAVTYILDEDWRVFFGRNKHMFPATFREALT
jgi:ATP-dependent DNA helicase DinG